MHIFFHGKKGIGKKQVAYAFAKSILKVENLNSSPDYVYISKNPDKRDIVIEQIRKDIIDNIYIAPAASDKKVYIIDDAENLNIAAQNALLKTLEEPPKYVVIILIASNTSSFLTTILSRVTKINFDGVKNEEVSKYLKENLKLNLNENVISFFDGSIGNIKENFENGNIEKLKDIDNLYNELLRKDEIKIFSMLSSVDFNNEIFLEYLEYLLYINGKYSQVKFVQKARNRLKTNGNYDIVIDNMILKIIESI